ncbi:unnamed protein product [Effrenium voratum]|nr:unnamed protein product [Effrenium voratum]
MAVDIPGWHDHQCDRLDSFNISACLALTGEVLASVRLSSCDTIGTLCQRIAQATGEASTLQILHRGRVLDYTRDLASFGLHSDCRVEVVKNHRLVLTGSSDGTAKIFRADGQCLLTMCGHGKAVTSACFAHSGLKVATASQDGTAKLWVDGACQATLQGHGGCVVSVDFSPDDALLVTASNADNTGRIWNLESLECQRVLGGYELNAAKFTPDGLKVLTAVSWHDCALLWSVATGDVLQRFAPHDAVVSHTTMSHDMSTVATATYDGTLKLWWAVSGKLRARLTGFGEKSKVHVAFSPDDRHVASACINHVAQVWDISAGTVVTLGGQCGHGNSVTSAEFSADGAWVVTGSYDGTAKIWDPQSGKVVRTLSGHTDSVRSVCFSFN